MYRLLAAAALGSYGASAHTDAISLVQLHAKRESNEAELSLPTHLIDLSHRAGKKRANEMAWDLCDVTVSSNLGGFGPDVSAPMELRFTNVTTYQGKILDLVIKNTTTYSANDINRNTARGCFGVVNIKAGTSVELNVMFTETGTNNMVNIADTVYFSAYDIDTSAQAAEMIHFPAGHKDFHVHDSTELAVSSSAVYPLQLQATNIGYGWDNPPPEGDQQLKRTVSIEYESFSVIAPKLEDLGSQRGRNFLFAGKSILVKPPKGSETTTTKPGGEQCFDCVIWGDPHVITFDVNRNRRARHPLREAFFRTRGWKSDEISVYDEGTFWLVKSENVHIQGRYWHNATDANWTNLGALAIGGPFLSSNTLVIRPLTGQSTWNSEEILSTLPSTFENEFVSAKYHTASEIVKDGTIGNGIDLELPQGVRLTVNRWMNNLAVKISMCAQDGGQDGQCGNYNGDMRDDAFEDNAARQRLHEEEFLEFSMRK